MEFVVLADIHNEWTRLSTILRIAQQVDGVIFLGDLIQQGAPDSRSLDNFLQIFHTAKWLAAVPGNGATPDIIALLDKLHTNVHGASKTYQDLGFFGVGGVTDTVEVVLGLREYFARTPRAAIELDSKALETLNVFGVFIKDGFFEVEKWSSRQVRELEKYHSPFEHTEQEVYEILVRAHESIADFPFRILLSHIPPYQEGLNPILPEGVSTGSRAITQFIGEYHPTFVISAHYHRNYQFSIESVPCTIIPAVKDGYYSLFHCEPNAKRFWIDVRRF